MVDFETLWLNFIQYIFTQYTSDLWVGRDTDPKDLYINTYDVMLNRSYNFTQFYLITLILNTILTY